jgi:hypothetical protein
MLIVDGPDKIGTRVSGYSNSTASISDLPGGTYKVIFYPSSATTSEQTVNGKKISYYPNNHDCLVEKTIAIPEYIRPIIDIPLSGGISCENGLTNMTITVGQGSKPAFSYRYKVAGAADDTYTPANFQASNVFTNIAPGTYTIQVKDQCGSITTQNIRVFNGKEQFVGIIGEVQPGVICQGREVILSVLSIGPVQWYKWYYRPTDTGNWTPLSSTGPTYTIASANQSHKGYYKVQIYNGLCELESEVHIIDVLPPAAKPAISGPTLICTGGSGAVLTAQLSGAIASPSYQWYKGGTAITGANAATYTVTSAGSYTVDVTPYQACPSDQSNAHVVTEQTLSKPSISASATTICSGSSATLTTTYIETATYNWYRGGTFQQTTTTNTYTATIAGTYTVTTALTGCTSSMSDGVTIIVNQTVTPAVVISAGTTGFEVCENNVSQIELTASPTNGGTASYVWKVNDSQVGTGATFTLSNLKQYRPGAKVTCTMTPGTNISCPSSPTATDEKNIRISSCVIPVNPHIRGRIAN